MYKLYKGSKSSPSYNSNNNLILSENYEDNLIKDIEIIHWSRLNDIQSFSLLPINNEVLRTLGVDWLTLCNKSVFEETLKSDYYLFFKEKKNIFYRNGGECIQEHILINALSKYCGFGNEDILCFTIADACYLCIKKEFLILFQEIFCFELPETQIIRDKALLKAILCSRMKNMTRFRRRNSI